jgi:hypothetical protein
MIRFSPRYFVLPLLALVVIGSLPAPANTGNASARAGCGPTVSQIIDPALRASFARFDRTQSASANQVCALYHNGANAPASR